MDMVERVARALFEMDDPPLVEGKVPSLCDDVWSEDYRKKARAAIAAMREPTEETIDAGAADEVERLWRVIYDAAHLAATNGSGADGRLRSRFMCVSNMLNAAIGRVQSSHGNQYDEAGNVTKVGQFEISAALGEEK